MKSIKEMASMAILAFKEHLVLKIKEQISRGKTRGMEIASLEEVLKSSSVSRTFLALIKQERQGKPKIE